MVVEVRDPGFPYGEFDARKWVEEFDRLFPWLLVEPEDKEVLFGWFANAIMTGYDKGRNEYCEYCHQMSRHDLDCPVESV